MKKTYPTYEEAQRIVRENGISSMAEYKTSYKIVGLPSHPDAVYDGEWCGWSSFWGKTKAEYPSYEEAKRIVRENGISGKNKYKTSYKKLGLPSDPNHYYSKEWCDWPSFLGKTKKEYPSYEEAKKIIKESGISSTKEYKVSCKILGLPTHPSVFYDKEWCDWYTFLGKSKQTSQEDRKYNLFKKFAINPVLLKDAPLKVLYIYFSKFRGITDGITSLLATSSYEERLNWVKEQLNSLKDGSLSKDKSSGELDELSAMESVLEENDDVKKSLSGEDAERFNILLENYVHSVVNRELISEVDDK